MRKGVAGTRPRKLVADLGAHTRRIDPEQDEVAGAAVHRIGWKVEQLWRREVDKIIFRQHRRRVLPIDFAARQSRSWARCTISSSTSETVLACASVLSLERKKEFTEPVALSSTRPADLPLPRRTVGLSFNLLALRARCAREPMGRKQWWSSLAPIGLPQFALFLESSAGSEVMTVPFAEASRPARGGPGCVRSRLRQLPSRVQARARRRPRVAEATRATRAGTSSTRRAASSTRAEAPLGR
jgi:hypothetical protein